MKIHLSLLLLATALPCIILVSQDSNEPKTGTITFHVENEYRIGGLISPSKVKKRSPQYEPYAYVSPQNLSTTYLPIGSTQEPYSRFGELQPPFLPGQGDQGSGFSGQEQPQPPTFQYKPPSSGLGFQFGQPPKPTPFPPRIPSFPPPPQQPQPKYPYTPQPPALPPQTPSPPKPQQPQFQFPQQPTLPPLTPSPPKVPQQPQFQFPSQPSFPSQTPPPQKPQQPSFVPPTPISPTYSPDKTTSPPSKPVATPPLDTSKLPRPITTAPVDIFNLRKNADQIPNVRPEYITSSSVQESLVKNETVITISINNNVVIDLNSDLSSVVVNQGKKNKPTQGN